MKNRKALSPIFAVLILIAIAVIAGIVVYMFTSGYLATMFGGGTAGQEKVAIQAVSGSDFNDTITFYAKSTAGGAVNITNVFLKNTSGQVIGTATVFDPAIALLPANGTLLKVIVEFTASVDPEDLLDGTTYVVALISQEGNQFVSPSFKCGP